MNEQCPWYWGSHGCDLVKDHDGNHQCLVYEYAVDNENPQFIVDKVISGVPESNGYRATGIKDVCSEKEQGSEELYL